jgi:hypothetical protein
MFGRAVIILAALALFAAAPAQAKQLAFTADLSGDKAPTNTGSKATGSAQILLDTDHQTVDMTLDVKGLKIADLWNKLMLAPVGPIHLHKYGSRDRSDPNSSSLAMPVPFGLDYVATEDGFRVVVKNYPYARGAETVKSGLSFADFVTSLENGEIVLNIHTNAKTDGEISGEVVPAKS